MNGGFGQKEEMLSLPPELCYRGAEWGPDRFVSLPGKDKPGAICPAGTSRSLVTHTPAGRRACLRGPG